MKTSFDKWHHSCLYAHRMTESELPPNLPIDPPKPTWKSRARSLAKNLQEKARAQYQKHFSQGFLETVKQTVKKSIQEFDPQALMTWVSKLVQRRGTAFYGTLATITLSTFFLSDLTALLVSDFIPEPLNSPSQNRRLGISPRTKSPGEYNAIFSRNLFNSQGLIPGENIPGGGGPSGDMGGPPVKTSLPLNLVGTLIMANELRSIATLEDKSSSTVYPVRAEDEIPGKIRVLKVEPRKVIFVNVGTGKREFVDLPDDATIPILNPRINVGSGGVEKVSPTQFNVSRVEVDRALSDFNRVLTEARAVPNFENGVASGYKLFQIVPGSIYDKLGLQNGDIISGLNGQPINDPGKAFEMLSELKTSNHLELQVKKDGKASTYTYDIR